MLLVSLHASFNFNFISMRRSGWIVPVVAAMSSALAESVCILHVESMDALFWSVSRMSSFCSDQLVFCRVIDGNAW